MTLLSAPGEGSRKLKVKFFFLSENSSRNLVWRVAHCEHAEGASPEGNENEKPSAETASSGISGSKCTSMPQKLLFKKYT